MIRLAILSDVHADVQALTDALAQAQRLGCTMTVCAGDLVDCGSYPQETIDLLIYNAIPCIRGNHDRWALGGNQAGAPTAAPLTPSVLRYLALLPLAWNAFIEGVRVAVRHGTPHSDMEGIDPDRTSIEDACRFLEQAAADVLLVGHTHIPFALATLGGGLIANPGALLRAPASEREAHAWIFDPDRGTFSPGPAPGGGTFGVLELPARRFTVHRASDGAEVEIPRLALGIRDRRER